MHNFIWPRKSYTHRVNSLLRVADELFLVGFNFISPPLLAYKLRVLCTSIVFRYTGFISLWILIVLAFKSQSSHPEKHKGYGGIILSVVAFIVQTGHSKFFCWGIVNIWAHLDYIRFLSSICPQTCLFICRLSSFSRIFHSSRNATLTGKALQILTYHEL